MPLKETYPAGTTPSIASYDYTDISDGQGFVKYFLGVTPVSATTTYCLSRTSFYSEIIYTGGTAGSDTPSGVFNQNFTTTMNTPRTIVGTAIVSIPTLLSFTGSIYVKVTLSKISGGVTTQLATATSPTYSNTSPTSLYTYFSTPLTIARTHFKKEDTLQLNVELHAWGSASGVWRIGHDPKGRTLGTGSDGSEASILVPFDIDD